MTQQTHGPHGVPAHSCIRFPPRYPTFRDRGRERDRDKPRELDSESVREVQSGDWETGVGWGGGGGGRQDDHGVGAASLVLKVFLLDWQLVNIIFSYWTNGARSSLKLR